MKKLIFALALLVVTSAHAALIELSSADEFNNLIQTSSVPVVVQFSAYWCGPCQQLKGTMKKVAEGYNDSQVKIAYVDAYENDSLGDYVQGGYPTVRTFSHGTVGNAAFVGSRSESFVKSFIDELLHSRGDGSDFCRI